MPFRDSRQPPQNQNILQRTDTHALLDGAFAAGDGLQHVDVVVRGGLAHALRHVDGEWGVALGKQPLQLGALVRDRVPERRRAADVDRPEVDRRLLEQSTLR